MHTDGIQDMQNDTSVPSDKSSIISRVPYRACVMVIISATVAKVTQHSFERMPFAWIVGGDNGRNSASEKAYRRYIGKFLHLEIKEAKKPMK